MPIFFPRRAYLLVSISLAALSLGACSRNESPDPGAQTSTQPSQTRVDAITTGTTKSEGPSNQGTATQTPPVQPGVEPAPGWGQMTAIDPGINQFSYDMSEIEIAINHKGEALAVWYTVLKENDPSRPRLMAAVYKDHRWEPAFHLSQDPAQDPAIAINDQGDMVVSYLRRVYDAQESSYSEERWVRRAKAWTWLEPERIGHAEPTGLKQQYGGASMVSLEAKGNAMMVFQQSGPHPGLFSSYLSNEQWSPPKRLDKAVAGSYRNFSFSGNLEGRGMLVWMDSTLSAGASKSYSTLLARAFHQGNWAEPVNLGEDTLKDFAGIQAPLVRVDSQGNAIAVYTQKHGQLGSQLKSRDYNRFTEHWDLPKSLAPGGYTGYGAEALAMNRNGDAALVWTVKAGTIKSGSDKLGGRVSYRARGQQAWGQGLDFVEHDSTIEAQPGLAMNGEGQVWIIWDQPRSNTETPIHLRSLDPVKGLGAISTPMAGKRYKVRANRPGHALVATRRTVIRHDPKLGYYSEPTVAWFTPDSKK